MDTDVVKAFNAELTSVYDSRPPLSKNKIQDISKAALKAKPYYKHVVFSVEKFLGKCKVEYKIPCLYVIDSIIRASKRQFKDKDVYGSRFLKNFTKTLNDLLQCPPEEQCRVVRTMNLWGANGVFTDEMLQPFKEQCRNMGIETDLEAVERAVKGKRADMSIYGGSYTKKSRESSHHRHSSEAQSKPQFEARTPPMPHPSLSGSAPGQATPTLPTPAMVKEEPSTEVPPGCISEQQLLELLRRAGCDFGGSYSSDIGLLRQAHALICDTLRTRQNEILMSQKSGNIKNLLSSQFDYSDEEDSGDEGNRKQTEQPEPKPMTTQEVLDLASTIISNPNVVNGLKTLQQERMMKLNQVAMLAQQRAMSNLSSGAAVSSSTNTSLPPPGMLPPPSLPTSMPMPTSSMPMTMPGANGQLPAGVTVPASMPGLPPGLQLPPGGLQALASLPGFSALSQLQGLAGLPPMVSAAGAAGGQANHNALLGLLSNQMNIPNLLAQPPPGLPFSPNRPPGMGGAPGGVPSQQNLELFKQQQEILKKMQAGQPMGVPPPGMASLLGVPPPQFNQNMQQANNVQLRMSDDMDMMRAAEEEDSSRRKRSRSRDRGDHKRSKRSRSRDRKDKDKDRERRKLCLPPLQIGITIVASRTIWFGRLPANCSESDIRTAVQSAGETRGVTVIQSRACAYVEMDSRKSAAEVITKLARDLNIKGRNVKVNYSMSAGVKAPPYKDWWDAEKGVTAIPWGSLPNDLEPLCVGAHLDIESLPTDKQGLFTETGAPAVHIPLPDAQSSSSGHHVGSEQDAMDVSSPTGDNHHMPSPTKAPGMPGMPQYPFMMPPPGINMPPGMPPGAPGAGLPYPMRMPPPLGRGTPIPGQMMMPPGVPPPAQGQAGQSFGGGANMPTTPTGGQGYQNQMGGPSPQFGTGGNRGGFGGGPGGFRGGRGGFRGGRGGGYQGERDWQGRDQPGEEPREEERDDMEETQGGRGRDRWSGGGGRREERYDGGRDRDRDNRDRGSRDRDGNGGGREAGGDRWRNADRGGGGDRGERRRSRWGDREEEDRRPERRDRDDSHREERARSRDDRRGDRDRGSDRDRRRDRGGEREERDGGGRGRDREERESRRDRSRDRDRERSRRSERESPKYDEGPAEIATSEKTEEKPMESAVPASVANVEAGAGGDATTNDDEMVTSTTDLEAAADAANKKKKFDEEMRRARISEDDMLDTVINEDNN